MNKQFKPPVPAQQRKKHMQRAIHSSEMEGHAFTNEDKALLMKCANGEISGDEFRDIVRARVKEISNGQ